MANLADIMDLDQFRDEVANGYVRVTKHPTQKFFVCKYTEKAAFDKHWNAVTLNCRGLIFDADYNIIARPWSKFFNYGESRVNIDSHEPVEVVDKLDGSCGVGYYDIDGHYCIATLGSFASEQSDVGTHIWVNQYSNLMPPTDYTFLFEIIYPDNRIVLNYGDMRDLVLLGAVHIERGYYLGPGEAAGLLDWPGPVAKVFEYKSLTEALAAEPRKNAEGYVIRAGNRMTKLKQQDYVQLHKIVTGITERRAYEVHAHKLMDSLGIAISDQAKVFGRSVEYAKAIAKEADFIEMVPDEWFDWFKMIGVEFNFLYRKFRSESLFEYGLLVHDGLPTRKEYARIIKDRDDKALMWYLYDDNQAGAICYIVKQCRPATDRAFTVDSDA